MGAYLLLALMTAGAVARRASPRPGAPVIAGLAAGLVLAVLGMATFAVIDNAFLAIVSHQQGKIDGFRDSGMTSMRAWINADLEATAPGVAIILTIAGAFLAPSAPPWPTRPPPGPACTTSRGARSLSAQPCQLKAAAVPSGQPPALPAPAARPARRLVDGGPSGWPGTAGPGSPARSMTSASASRARRPRTPAATRIAAAPRGRCTRCAPSWATRDTRGGRCGTGSAPTAAW